MVFDIKDQKNRMLKQVLEEAVHKSKKVEEEVAINDDGNLSLEHQLDLYGIGDSENFRVAQVIKQMKQKNREAKFYQDISPENRIIASMNE